MIRRTPIGGPSLNPADPQSRVDWQACWLKDPRFKGVPHRDFVHPHRTPENNGEIQNIHTLYRREWTLPVKPIRQARLYITADDCYKLYLNGRFIGLGPAPAYPSDYPYNAWDVTEFLTSGRSHCIGVHTFYQGMHSLTFVSADNLQGLLLQLDIDFEDGTTTVLASDDAWRCLGTEAYEAKQIYGYQTAFSEHIDLRKLPHGWMEAGFDDSRWAHPCVGPVPDLYALSPQQTPPVAVYRVEPVRMVQKGKGHYFIDFGCELSGSTVFRVTGEAGYVVEIRHGEETDGEDGVRHEMRCNCTYQEFCTLSGHTHETLAFFDYKGFRYVEVLNWPEVLTPDNVWAHERHYPFPEKAAGFSSADPLLNRIWTLCRNGVRVGTLDTYLDCPTREKGGFMGDGFVTGISHLILTGDARILRKFLKDVAHTRKYCPGLLSTAPNRVNGELAEYSMLWPVLLEYYYRWTGDVNFVKEMMPVLQGLLTYYAGYENADGLLQDLFSHTTGRYSVLVDWPANLRDDYDDPFLMGARTETSDPRGVINTMVQGFYTNMLQAAERLAETVGDENIGTWVKGRVPRLAEAMRSQLRDPATGLFIDRNGSTHSALHANVTPLMAGILQGDESNPVLDFLRQKRMNCGVYFSLFLLRSLCAQGETELAYEFMTSRDLHSWHSMLESGATTCMEAWAPDLKWNTSWCHPWSSAPIHIVTHEIMGLHPHTPGWGEICFSPRPPCSLASASLHITTPRGMITAAFERGGEGITYHLTVPDGCSAICRFFRCADTVMVDDVEMTGLIQESARVGQSLTLPNPLPAGTHRITMKTF